MKPKRLPRELIFLAVLTTITVFTWIFLSVFYALTKPQPPKVPQEQLRPLDPTLETKVIDNLGSREFINKGEVSLPQSTTSGTTKEKQPQP